MFYCNAYGILNKITELKTCVSLYNVNIVCVNETHLDGSILDAEIQMSGFKMFRHDRDFSIESCTNRDHDVCPGGGSIIYVSDNLSCSEIESLRKIPDSIAVAIHTNVGIMNFVCFYHNPSVKNKIKRRCGTFLMELLSKKI